MKSRITTFVTRATCIALAIGAPSSYALDQHGKRIGLVLSGGAARGLSHIGVLKALREQGIEVDAVAGTSMGAIVGGMYASGYSTEQIEQIGTTLDWSYGLSDKPYRRDLTFRRKLDDRRHLFRSKLTIVDGDVKLPAGAIDGQNLGLVIQDIFYHTNDIDNFDNLKIPFRAVATDLETGEAVIMANGSLNTAIRASMSIPGLLAPVERDGKLLADGGMADNMPVDVVRAMNVDRVIAVSIGAPLSKAADLQDLFSVSNQVTSFLTMNNVRVQMQRMTDIDVLLEPDLKDIGSLDFSRAQEAIDLGYQTTMAQAQALASFKSEKTPVGFEVTDTREPRISAVQMNNNSYMNDEALKLFIKQPLNQPLDKKLLQHNINTLYGLDYFSQVSYRLQDDTKGGKILEIELQGKERRTDFMRFGFSVSDDTQNNNAFNISAAYNRTGISDYGAEWFSQIQIGNVVVLKTELYAPIGYESPVYLLPSLEYTSREIPVYDENFNRKEQILRDRRTSAALYMGYQFSHFTDISVGLARSTGDVSLEAGSAQISNQAYDLGYVEGKFILDGEDDVYFPSSGGRVDIAARQFDERLGSEENYYEIDALVSRAFNYGKNTFIPRFRVARSDGTNSIPSNRFYLGGLGLLSGMPEDSIITQNNDLVSLIYYRSLAEPLLMFDTSYYLISSIEYGRAWNNKSSPTPYDSGDVFAGSLGVAMDSPIGPVILAYGFNSSEKRSVYFSIGRPL